MRTRREWVSVADRLDVHGVTRVPRGRESGLQWRRIVPAAPTEIQPGWEIRSPTRSPAGVAVG